MSDWDNILSNEVGWGGQNFVQKHKASARVVDFANQIQVDELMRFETVKELSFEIPEKDNALFFVTTKVFSLLDVVHYIERSKGAIDEAILYVYTINDKGARYISDLSKRTKLKLIISDLINSKREKERLISSVLEENNVDFIFCHNHAKIMSFKIGEDYYTLDGSMNAGNNARIESLRITNSKKMYDFIKETAIILEKDFKIEKRY